VPLLPDATRNPSGARQPLPAVIANSWRRAELYGLNPSKTVDRLTMAEVDRDSRLMRSAKPVLDELAEQMVDTGYCVVLADRDARIVSRRFGTRSVERRVDRVGIDVGCRFVEETTGTNAIATPHELRKGVAVRGAEHYLEAFREFTCYGYPIVHPITRRLEGVLDITCRDDDATPLLGPFLRRAVCDIERRMLDGARESERYLFAAFRAARHRAAAVLALDDDIMLANAAAAGIVDAADRVLLLELMPKAGSVSPPSQRLELSSGSAVDVSVEAINGSSGVLFELLPVGVARRPVPRRKAAGNVLALAVDRELRDHRAAQRRVLVCGEPGTGRTTSVRHLAGDEPLVLVDATDVPAMGAERWCSRVEGLLAEHHGLIAVECIHLLSPVLAAWLARRLDDSPVRVAATSAPLPEPAPEHRSLAARFVSRVELPPLRSRRDELSELARMMLATHKPGGSLRFSAEALRLLESLPWPGNLRELEAVVHHAARARSAGDIVAGDLPPAYRERTTIRPLSPWEQAEHDAIIKALRACGGNKVHTADLLGISRSTLYNRIRALRITAP
jgi:sigma-54 dependent transcriptional regulator, acetoin dehydrogenase operon transcriptional activator AcoR